jgi:hypothetical protein
MERWMPDPTEFPEAEQERAQALIRSANTTAPAGLRASLEAQIRAAEHDQQHRRWRPESLWRRDRRAGRGTRFGVPALVGVVAIAAVAILVAVSGGSTPTALNLRSAAAVALRTPTSAAPGQTGARLDVSTDGISFPYWQGTVGWRAVGTRADTVNGRRVVTVFYTAPTGQRVGYSIVSGGPLRVPAATVIHRDGIDFAVLPTSGAHVVTWERDGHTCVLASRTASASRMITLAVSPA